MDIETFWAMIDSARLKSGGELESYLDLLIESLEKLSIEEIIAFDDLLYEMDVKAKKQMVWDAGQLILCGCSEDTFMDFRDWLIAQGKEVFEKAIENPDSLVDVVDVTIRDDDKGNIGSYIFFGVVARDAYENKTGQAFSRKQREYKPIAGTGHAEEEFATVFPRLTAKLGDCDSWWDAYLNRTPQNPDETP
jgi:hypothetical protein